VMQLTVQPTMQASTQLPTLLPVLPDEQRAAHRETQARVRREVPVGTNQVSGVKGQSGHDQVASPDDQWERVLGLRGSRVLAGRICVICVICGCSERPFDCASVPPAVELGTRPGAENGDSPSERRRRTWRGTVPIFGSCPAPRICVICVICGWSRETLRLRSGRLDVVCVICGRRPCPPSAVGPLDVEFQDVFVREDVAALDALAVVAGVVPEPGELEVRGDVFVQVIGRVDHGRADG
jgi:hypothetical protein